jgi:hypothetical protein
LQARARQEEGQTDAGRSYISAAGYRQGNTRWGYIKMMEAHDHASFNEKRSYLVVFRHSVAGVGPMMKGIVGVCGSKGDSGGLNERTKEADDRG